MSIMQIATRPTNSTYSRALSRWLAFAAAALALFIFTASAASAQIVVNEPNDDNNGNSLCSLREAVEAANTNSAVDGCAAGSEDGDQITFDITAAGLPIVLDGGELLIEDDVTINGSSLAGGVTIDAQDNSRIFDVAVASGGGGAGSQAAVTFQSLTLMNGNSNNGGSSGPNAGGAVDIKADDDVTFTDVNVMGSIAGVNGGGIHAAGGTTLTITTTDGGASTISGNTAQGTLPGDGTTPVRGGGGVWGAGSTTISGNVTIDGNTASGTTGSGGGVLNEGGMLDIQMGVSITNNTATRAGGGIEDNGGTSTTVTDATVTGNDAGTSPGNGGGLHSGGGDVTVSGGTFSGNTAQEGGGLWTSGMLSISGTTIDGNAAEGARDDENDGMLEDLGGGGVYIQGGGTLTIDGATQITNNLATGPAGSGGGVLNNASTLSITGATISGNTADRAGGGIEDANGTTTLTNVTLTDNEATGATSAGNGGGLHSGGGDVTVTGGSATGNIAVEGGGLWTNSTLVVNGMDVSSNTATGDDADQGGGGLYNQGGAMTVTGNTTITGNVANGTSGSGGGILNNGGSLSVTGGSISGNTANRAGGGIEDAGDMDGDIDVRLEDVTLSGNMIGAANPGNGGGLHSGGGDVEITDGSVTSNTAQEGGGLWTSGTLTISGTTIDGNAANGARDDEGDGTLEDLGGGGIYVESTNGSVTITNDASVTNNTATGDAGSGGGILVNDGSTLTMTLGEVSGNMANRAGGGIEIADDGTTSDMTMVTLRRVTVDGNSIMNAAPGNGGGLHSGGAGQATVRRSTFSNNSAAEGGGLWASGSSTFNIAQSTISGNSATVQNGSSGNGGGVYDNGGADISILSSTVAMNSAEGDGGGLLATSAGNVSVGNTIVGQGNTAGGTGDDIAGPVDSDGFNLIESTDGATISGDTGTNITGVSPMLMPLADNGGPTLTHKLMPSSPAGDAGSNLTGASTDQRSTGFQRTFNDTDVDDAPNSDGTDIGALEVSDGSLPVELAGFTGRADGQNVVLQWTTATEENNHGFHIEQQRGGENASWERVAFEPTRVQGGTSTAAQSYERSLSVLDYGSYTFRLVQEDTDGTSTPLSQTVSVEVALDAAFNLTEVYPNPVRSDGATVRLTVREAQHVTVMLYDALGRQVKTLHEGAVSGGETLPLRVESGRLASGVYLLRATGEHFSASRKIVMVR